MFSHGIEKLPRAISTDFSGSRSIPTGKGSSSRMLIPHGSQKFKGRNQSVFQVSTISSEKLSHGIIYIIH